MNFKPYPRYILRRPAFNYDCGGLSDEILIEMLDNKYFLEAIYYASPELYKELVKNVNAKDKEKLQSRTLDTIYKYLSRLRYRSTPFGIFAMCGVGEYGESILIPDGTDIIKSYKYDGQLIYNVANHIFNEEFDKLSNIRLKLNETILRVGNYYYLWARVNNSNMELIKIPVTELLQFCVSNTAEVITLDDLKNRISDEFEIGKVEINNYINNLCKKGVLINNLFPETVGSDNLKRLESVINEKNIDTVELLRDNMDRLCKKIPLQEKLQQINTIEEVLQKHGIKYKEKQFIQVDSYLKENAVLPSSVSANLQEIFTIYKSFSIPIQNSLGSFIKRYQGRYEQESVSVLEALNPVSGIGYQSNMGVASNIIKSILIKHHKQDRKPQSMNIGLSILEQVVLKKINETGNLNIGNIQLTYKDIKPYINDNAIDTPLSYTAMFKIVGYNDYGPIISNLNFSGTSGTSLLTRFAHGNNEIDGMVKEIADIEQRNNPDCILAEISHLTSPHSENVQSRPLLRSAIIPFASLNSAESHTIVDIRDLYIRISNGKIHLYSKKLDKEVLPCFSSAFNYNYNSSELYKFLGDIYYQYSNRVLKPSFQGLLKLFNHTPRILYKNVIISPECWLITKDDLFEKKKFSKEKFVDYCSGKNMPRFLMP